MRGRVTLVAAAALAVLSSGCALYNGIAGVCEGDVYTAQVNQTIPDDNETGITSQIIVPLSGRPDGIGVKVELEHRFEGEVRLRLAHNNIVVELDDIGDTGPFHEFDGVDVNGPWILNAADTISADTGYWTSWELSICN